MTNTAGPHFILSDAQRGTETGQYQGKIGNYWSSSAYTSATYAYLLGLRGIDSTVVYPALNGSKGGYGFTLRCLAHFVFIMNQIKTQRVFI